MFHGPNGNQLDDSIVRQTDAPASRPIFRTEIRQRYLQNQARIELPPLISTRAFTVLWILALLLIAAGTLVAFWPLI